MWLLILLLLFLLLIFYELLQKPPSSCDEEEIYVCLDYNHNPIHWTRCAVTSIVATVVTLLYLSLVTLRNFMLVFLIIFVGSYFSANWMSAHLNRNVDYKIEPYVEHLYARLNKE